MSYLGTPCAFSDEVDGSPIFDGSSAVLGFTPVGGVYTINRPLDCSKFSITGSAVVIMVSGNNASDFICARHLYIEASAKLLWPGNSAVGATGGAAITAGGTLNSAAGSGGAGGNNAVGGNGGGSGGNSMGGSGGAGGSAGANGGGSGNNSTTLTVAQQRMARSLMYGVTHRIQTANTFVSVNGSGGGGGGGGLNNTGTGVGGGGGGAAPQGACHVGLWEVYGTVGCPGGNGANGAVTGNGVAGGGGGGSGGYLWAQADRVINLGTLTVAGGKSGNGAGGGNPGFIGLDGTIVFLVGGRLV